MVIWLVACTDPVAPENASKPDIHVTFCDKAESLRLARVGIGGANTLGGAELIAASCESNEHPLGCTFRDVQAGTYLVQDVPTPGSVANVTSKPLSWSALVYAGPSPGPQGDVHVTLACQSNCGHTIEIANQGCAGKGSLTVYSAEPAAVATKLAEASWVAGADGAFGPFVPIGETTCNPLVAEIVDETCGATILPMTATSMRMGHKVTLTPPTDVSLSVRDAAGTPLVAEVIDAPFRSLKTDAKGALTLRRTKGADATIWVHAPGHAGGLFSVPAEGPMTVTLLPTRSVSVTCSQGGVPCAGPLVYVGAGLSQRVCESESAAFWRCDAAEGDAVWARQGQATGKRVDVTGSTVQVEL